VKRRAVHPRSGSVTRWRGEGGFTISELILVSVFVVGLIFVAVRSAQGIEDQNRHSNCQTELRNLKMAVAEVHAERGNYPQTVDEVVSAGKVESDDVDSWVLVGKGPDEEPDYRPVAGLC
jgi:Tfp pilus assembly protein PilE